MIILGCDHGGFELKEKIKEYFNVKGYRYLDVGAYKLDEHDNFPDYINKIMQKFNDDKNSKIIALCGSGIGVNIALNKNKGVFSAVGHSVEEVELARKHNNINALTFGGRVTSLELAINMIETFLNTDFIGGKYQMRMTSIDLK